MPGAAASAPRTGGHRDQVRQAGWFPRLQTCDSLNPDGAVTHDDASFILIQLRTTEARPSRCSSKATASVNVMKAAVSPLPWR